MIITPSESGGGAVKNEVCSFEDSEVTCVEQESALEDYAYYPELFLVESNFGKDATKCL